jgi:octaprenyl-diphosphate synthase
MTNATHAGRPPRPVASAAAPTPSEDAPARAEAEAFTAELEQVSDQLFAALDGLYPPLSSLARAAVRGAMPLRRGALVLATGVAGNGETSLPPDLLRERRIRLAAALEMLSVALDIHANLLVEGSAQSDRSLDKSIVGSTILTGDFCFSRAAWLAAQTESPVVVDLFAQALKSVSEGLLRAQMQPGPESAFTDDSPAPFRSDLELALASVHAAAHLAGLDAEAERTACALAPRFARDAGQPSGEAPVLSGLAPAQKLRWQAALEWLAALPAEHPGA